MEKAKPIQKKLLHAGVGPSDIDIPDGTKLKFHFVTKKIDGTLLDDSRKWDKPMELLIGKKFKLEAWEMCLKTMRLQEVSSFVVKRVYACEYPTVAKTLRDTFGMSSSPVFTNPEFTIFTKFFLAVKFLLLLLLKSTVRS